jgi:O-antigen/teichoic acid export membrane protein
LAAVSIGSGLYALVNFVSSLLITRALGAEQYGYFTVGLVVYGLLLMLIDGGHARALLAAKSGVAAADRAARAWVLVAAIGFSALALVTAPALGVLLRTPGATPAVIGCTLAALTATLGLVDGMVLRRLDDAVFVQWAGVGANVAAYLGIGVVVSLLTHSWVGPVAATVVYGAVVSGVLRSRRRALAPTLGTSDRWSTARPETFVFISGLVSWLVTQVDTLSVAVLGGAALTASYSRGYFLAFAVPTLIATAVAPVVASSIRRTDTIWRIVAISVALSAVNLPIAVVSFVSSDITRLVYGPGFESAGYFRVLVLAGALWAAALPWSLSLQQQGHRRGEAAAQALPLVGFAVLMAVPSDLSDQRRVAVAVLAGCVLRVLAMATLRARLSVRSLETSPSVRSSERRRRET